MKKVRFFTYLFLISLASSLTWLFDIFTDKKFFSWFMISFAVFFIIHSQYYKLYQLFTLKKVKKQDVTKGIFISTIFMTIILAILSVADTSYESVKGNVTIHGDYLYFIIPIVYLFSILTCFFTSIKSREFRKIPKWKTFLGSLLFYVSNYFLSLLVSIIITMISIGVNWS